MAIYRFFKERAFEPEAVICMARAYESALLALRLTDRQDLLTEIVAKKIIEIAETGERDPDRLRDRALEEIGHEDNERWPNQRAMMPHSAGR
jgi:hypothetical protein